MKEGEGGMLAPEERRILLSLARSSVVAAVTGTAPPDSHDVPEALQRPSGVFVTLHLDGELRGCVGVIQAAAPLAVSVVRMARQAALHDPRFFPLSEGELPGLDIEISVLSPLRQAERPEDVEVGIHGIYVTAWGRSGLLLPQVAREMGWTREEFLSHTCLKAGLPPDAWRESGTTLHLFTAEVFGEKDNES